jgi:putative DNA primase/helicase
VRVADVAAALGDARREGRVWRCRCPLHGGRSLVVRDGDGGRLLVTCWGGCDRLAVIAELRRIGLFGLPAFDDWRRTACPPRRPNDDGIDDSRRIAIARSIWDAAQPALRTPVVRYLTSRAIALPPPSCLRWAPRCWHGLQRQEMPAMVGLVEHVERGVVGIHRTYLLADGTAKAALPKEQQKRTLGSVGGGAVRLGAPRPGQWLAVGEGIETTLAVMTACSMPGWAALSAGGIAALVLPPEANHVIVCADHDNNGVGQRAANQAAERWVSEGRRVRIALPPEPDTDFNDLLTDPAYGCQGVRYAA